METLAARKAYGFGPDAAKPTAHIIDSAGWNSLLAARQRAQICVTAALAVITLGLNYSAVFTDPLATMRVITLSRPIGHNPGLTGRLLVSLCLLLLPLLGQAQSVAVTHCQGECPRYSSQVASRQSNIVIHHLYASAVNGNSSLPDWVAYRLTADAIGVASLLTRTWQPDRLLEFSPLEDVVTLGELELNLSESVSQSNNPYGGGAAQLVEPDKRARLAPMTSFANTPYWPDLNNFSNMVPMPAPLRLGPWSRLEQRLNQLTMAEGELYVITGPLFLVNNLSLSPSNSELNPAAYFKLVSDATGVVTFFFPEGMGQADSFCDNTADFSDIEEMTGISFFPGRASVPASPFLLEKLGCSI